MVASVVAADILATKIQFQLSSCNPLSCNKSPSPQGRQLSLSVQVNHSDRCAFIFALIWNTLSEERFFCCLKCLDIQWRTKQVYTEKFLINDPNDLGLLPLLSFPEIYVLYKQENKKYTANERIVHTSDINICAWTKDPWTYTSPLGYIPRQRQGISLW